MNKRSMPTQGGSALGGKIAIDARLYGTGHAGIGRYVEQLIKKLEKADQENQYIIFLQKSNFDQYQPENSNFQKVLADYRVYSIGEQLFFPSIIKKQKPDLVHFPHFNVPLFYRDKFIVTIHDLIISHYPNSRSTTLPFFVYKIKLFFYDLIIKSTAKRAKKIIAISEFTKNDISKILKVDDKKIQVVYEGVDLPKDSQEDCSQVLADLQINSDFILYVGSAYPHKNLDRLLLAFKDVVEIKSDLKLVLVGKINYFYQKLKKEIERLNLQNNVILTDYVSDERLVCLYKKAELYIFPSLIEGFGLPPLEAQSYDLPVISSNKTCLPEILGDSALFFDPEDLDDIKNKVVQGLDDESLRNKLVEAGKDNLCRYSWEKMAEEIISIYLLEK